MALVRRGSIAAASVAVLAALVSSTAFAQSPNALRGQRLYETVCTNCHEESVHSRKQKVARSIGEIREFVTRWAKVANAPWGPEEIDDVAIYLNERYYRFICPAGSTCKDERADTSRPRGG